MISVHQLCGRTDGRCGKKLGASLLNL